MVDDRINPDYLLNFPLRKFSPVYGARTPHVEYVYLLNYPIRDVDLLRSEDKVALSGMGSMCFLNSMTYNLGYLFELPRSNCSAYDSHIFIGNPPPNIERVGDISTRYLDENIIILQNKRNSSFLIIPNTDSDIPEPIV